MANAAGLSGTVISCCGVASIFLFIMLLVVLGFVLAFRSKRAFKNALKAVALETGCTYDRGGCLRGSKVIGVFRGRSIMVDSYREHHGADSDSSTTYTRLQVDHSGNIPGTINVYPQTLLSSVGKKLGMQDIRTGNPEFDKAFIVKGSDENMVRRILDMDVQQKMLGLKTAVQVHAKRVYVQQRGYIKDKRRLMDLLNLMSDIAERTERAG